jgi:hypothetical protein
MVTKLSRATGEVEYGLPVWLFLKYLISSVVSAFVGAIDLGFEACSQLRYYRCRARAAQIFDNLVGCSKENSSENSE